MHESKPIADSDTPPEHIDQNNMVNMPTKGLNDFIIRNTPIIITEVHSDPTDNTRVMVGWKRPDALLPPPTDGMAAPGPSVAFSGILTPPDVAEVLAVLMPRREATEREETAITLKPLYGPYLTQDYIDTLSALSPVGLEPSKISDIYRRRLQHGIKTFIAVTTDGTKERVVATATLLIEERFAYGGSFAGYIEDVAVHPLWQRRNIGLRLVSYVVEQAWKLDCRKVTLNCKPDLVPFYERIGFKPSDIFLRINKPAV